MGWMTGVQFPSGAVMGLFLFATASRPAPSISKVKNAWSCTSTPPCVFMGLHLNFCLDTVLNDNINTRQLSENKVFKRISGPEVEDAENHRSSEHEMWLHIGE
jgi:hypothetical protein